jgi:phage head-tail adaptor, putative, SPP1 family
VTSRAPYRPQRIGDLRERLELQKAESIRDPDGMIVETWTTQAAVFARVEPVKSETDILGGGRPANTETLLFHIRHRDVPTAWRILWRGKAYGIDGTRNLDERRQYLTITASHAE